MFQSGFAYADKHRQNLEWDMHANIGYMLRPPEVVYLLIFVFLPSNQTNVFLGIGCPSGLLWLLLTVECIPAYLLFLFFLNFFFLK